MSEKVVIITGASSGIGLATAKLLTEKGAKVGIVAQSQEELDDIANGLPGSFAIGVDLRKENEVREMCKKMLEHYGRIDILLNNAGRSYASLIEKIDTAKIREIFELNVLAPVELMQEVVPIMRKQGGGIIINISSGTVFMQPYPGMSTYVASKQALSAFSHVAREELKKDNIVVSTIYPYITATNFYKDTLNAGSHTEIPQGGNIPPADSAEHVAETIMKAIESGESDVFPHEWMREWQKKANSSGE